MRGITVRTFPKIHFRCFIVTVCLISFTYSSFACTAINLTAKDGTVIAGRTMEWPLEMKWELLAMPKGTPIEISAPIDLNLPATKISSKYAFVGIAPGILEGAPAFLEGQNEVGLGMSGNFLPEFTEYQSITAEDKQYVSIVNFGRLTLGMYGTVKELRAEIPKYKVWYDPKEVIGSPTPPFLHFVFTDRSGESIIIEFVKGEMVIHDNVANVLTNAPTYDWHLLNVRNHLSLSAESTASVEIDGAKVTEIGQGGGTLGIPADYTPPARFVRATYLRNFANQPAGSSEATQLMGHLLNNVDIPLGVAKTKEDGQMAVDYTQWVAIKDLTHNQLSIANYANRTNYIQIDLDRVFKSNKTMRWMINDLPYPSNDMTSELLK